MALRPKITTIGKHDDSDIVLKVKAQTFQVGHLSWRVAPGGFWRLPPPHLSHSIESVQTSELKEKLHVECKRPVGLAIPWVGQVLLGELRFHMPAHPFAWIPGAEVN